MKKTIVGLIETGLKEYPKNPPFPPPMIYPEFPYMQMKLLIKITLFIHQLEIFLLN